jgi:Nucleoside-diphosphate-sugar epimerases
VPVGFGPDDTVLITGGTGGLGRLVARHLVDVYGVGRVVLVSRSGEAVEGLGAGVSVVAGDVSDRDVVVGLLDRFAPTVVVHAAGVVRDGLLSSLGQDDVDVVWGAKVAGVRLLDELTRGGGVRAFVAFSSLAGVVGNAGQGGYAAANAVVDEVVRQRRAAGFAGVSIAWGPWAGDDCRVG